VTADASGNYTFAGLANGTYTVTPSKTGYTFTPTSRAVTLSGANRTGTNFTASAGGTANFTVDASQTFQAIDGMGVNINVNSWNGGQLQAALDSLVDANGSSLFRVVRDPMAWVSAESLIPALHTLDPTTLQQIYETPAMQDIWSTVGYLNAKGIGGRQIILNFMGWTPAWLGGSGRYGSQSYITAGKESAFATMVASLVYYGKRVKGLDFTYLSPLNEEDLDGIEGPLVSPAQYAAIMHALSDELDAMGLADIRFIAPDTAYGSDVYISSLLGDSVPWGRTDRLTAHYYYGTISPGAPYPPRRYWVTETAVKCWPCDAGGAISPSEEWAFARDTTDVVLDDLVLGQSAVLLWEGFDTFWYHHNAVSGWGLLAYDGTTYTPRKRFYANAQVNRFVRPGAQRVGVTTSLSALSHVVAFYDSATGRVTVVGHNSGSAPININGQLLNVPAGVSSLSVYFTSASTDLQQGPSIAVTGGKFTVTVPADAFFTLSY
jgi:O-glycosyl hydrolase